MNTADMFDIDIASTLRASEESGRAEVCGTDSEQRLWLDAIDGRLSELRTPASRVSALTSMDSAEYLLLRLGEDCGVSAEVADALCHGTCEAMEVLAGPLRSRVLLIDNAHNLTGVAGHPSAWDLSALHAERLTPVLRGMQSLRRVEAVAQGMGQRERGITLREPSELRSLWERSAHDIERFLLALALQELLGAPLAPDAPSDPERLVDQIHAVAPHPVRQLLGLLTTHERPFAYAWLSDLSISESVLNAAETSGLVSRRRGDLVVLPALARHWPMADAERGDAHRRLAAAFESLASREPLAALEAHRHLVDLGDFKRAAEYAQYSVQVMLFAAQQASKTRAWGRAIEGYQTVLSLAQHVTVEPRVIGYARHYLHFNRFRANEEVPSETLAGYRLALHDWPANALFWSRTIRCELYANGPEAATRALDEAYQSVPPHPQRDAMLRWRTADRLLERRQWLAALAMIDGAQARSSAHQLTRDQLLARLAEGVCVRTLWTPGVAPVSFNVDVPLRIVPDVHPGFAAVIAGVVGRGADPWHALRDLVAQVAPWARGSQVVAAEVVAREARETHYQRLGRTKGPDSTREARTTLRHWWVSQGAEAARWLVARIRNEHHWDVLHAIITILTAPRVENVEAVVAELEAGRLCDDARLCLLKVLAESVLDCLSDRVRAVLPAHSDDPDEREVLEEIRARLSATG